MRNLLNILIHHDYTDLLQYLTKAGALAESIDVDNVIDNSIGMKSVKDRLEIIVREGSHAKAILMLRELERTLDNKDVSGKISKGILNYIYAAGALAFSCRDINIGSIGSMLSAVKIKPEVEMLEAIHAMHYKNYNINMNIIYFMKAVATEPTIDGVTRLSEALGFGSDPTVAGYVIEYFKEFNKGRISYVFPTPTGDNSIVFNKTADMIFSLSAIISEFIINEIEKVIQDKRLASFGEAELLPYIGAVGLLTFSGFDVEKQRITKILGALNVSVNQVILDTISNIGIKNHIVYMTALYFVHAVGKDTTLDNVMNVVKVMDVEPDSETAGSVVSFYLNRLTNS